MISILKEVNSNIKTFINRNGGLRKIDILQLAFRVSNEIMTFCILIMLKIDSLNNRLIVLHKSICIEEKESEIK